MARPPIDPNVVLVGESPRGFADLYHQFLELRFGAALGVILLGLFGINTVFALGYLVFGGVANAEPGSFLDAFSFSMQTLATIGYGAMYPQGTAAKILSDIEAVCGLMATALATGLVFTKFTQTRPALRFTSKIVVSHHQGTPALVFRVGNDRGNLIVDATVRLVLMRTELAPDGSPVYKRTDLALVRDRSILFTRSWTLFHLLTPDSPLHGLTRERVLAEEIEISASLVGVDDTSLQTVHARKTWTEEDILFDHRLADILRPLPDGRIEADARRFDQVVPAQES